MINFDIFNQKYDRNPSKIVLNQSNSDFIQNWTLIGIQFHRQISNLMDFVVPNGWNLILIHQQFNLGWLIA